MVSLWKNYMVIFGHFLVTKWSVTPNKWRVVENECVKIFEEIFRNIQSVQILFITWSNKDTSVLGDTATLGRGRGVVYFHYNRYYKTKSTRQKNC